MPWAEIAIYLLALVLYPGALAMFALGSVAEVGSTWALVPARGGPVGALANLLRAARQAVAPLRLPLFATLAAFMTLVASIQVALPFNPIPGSERNLLVAAGGLIACGWITACWGWDRAEFDPALVLLASAAWLVALLAPTVETQTLRPQELGSVVLPAVAPVKVASAVLYVLTLPVLLQLIPEAAPQAVPGGGRRRRDPEEAGFVIVRALLWLPLCGLFASLYFPPPTDDLRGLVRFLFLAGGAGALALVLASNLIHRGALFTRRRYGLVLTGLGVMTVVIAGGTAVLDGTRLL